MSRQQIVIKALQKENIAIASSEVLTAQFLLGFLVEVRNCNSAARMAEPECVLVKDAARMFVGKGYSCLCSHRVSSSTVVIPMYTPTMIFLDISA